MISQIRRTESNVAPNPLGVPYGKQPDLEHWKRWVRSAPNGELLALEDTAYLVLRLKGNGFQEQWAAPYIDAVEEEIRHRRNKQRKLQYR